MKKKEKPGSLCRVREQQSCEEGKQRAKEGREEIGVEIGIVGEEGEF